MSHKVKFFSRIKEDKKGSDLFSVYKEVKKFFLLFIDSC